MHGYKYLPDVIRSLEEDDMEKNVQWKKFMSVRDSLDRSVKDQFELNLKNNPDVETFATLTQQLLLYNDLLSSKRQRFTIKNIEMICLIQYNKFMNFRTQ